MKLHLFQATGIAALLLAAPAAALAQTAGGTEAQATRLEEVIVTARKVSENLQRTPVAVTSLGAEDIRSANIVNFADVQTRTPGLQVAPAPNGLTSGIVSIRGILSNEIAPNYDPSVGIYLDGHYVGSTVGALIDSYVDLDHIEVLKGPQGTLYGRNTTGGAINIYTSEPVDTFEGEATAGLGNNSRREFSGFLNAPLTPRVALRIAGSFSQDDGYGRDIRNDRPLADRNVQIYRAALKMQLADATNLITRADYQRSSSGGSIVHPELLVFGGAAHAALALERFGLAGLTPQGLSSALAIWNAAAAGDQFTTQYNLQNNISTEAWGVSATLTHDFGPAQVKSLTGYRKVISGVDYDFAPLALVAHPQERTQIKQFTQEFQLNGHAFENRLNYVSGLFYFHNSFTDTAVIQLVPILAAIPTTFFNDDGKTRSMAAYAQATYAVTSTVNLTGGLRYTSEKKRLAVANFNGPFCGLPPTLVTGATCVLDRSLSFDDTSYTVGLDWTPSDALLVYAKRSRAFKSGGLPQRTTLDPQSAATFLPETVVTDELGLKSQSFDDRLRLNLAVYNSNYKNIQRSVVVPGFAGGPPTSVVQNAASARIRGAEVEATAIPLQNLVLTATAAYVDAKYRRFRDGLGRDLSQQKFQNQPKWTATLGAAYTVPVSAGSVKAQVDWYWRSSADLFPNGAADARYRTAHSYGLLNARVALKLDDQDVEISVWGKNILDESYITTAFDLSDSLGTVISTPGAPRTYGVQVRKRF